MLLSCLYSVLRSLLHVEINATSLVVLVAVAAIAAAAAAAARIEFIHRQNLHQLHHVASSQLHALLLQQKHDPCHAPQTYVRFH